MNEEVINVVINVCMTVTPLVLVGLYSVAIYTKMEVEKMEKIAFTFIYVLAILAIPLLIIAITKIINGEYVMNEEVMDVFIKIFVGVVCFAPAVTFIVAICTKKVGSKKFTDIMFIHFLSMLLLLMFFK